MLQREKQLMSNCPLFEICYGYKAIKLNTTTEYKAIKWAGMLYKIIVFVIQQIAIYSLMKWLIFVFVV